MMALFVASPFGAALRGTRDQPRRMSALGHNVWLIRWITFVYSAFWGAVSGILFVYYNKLHSPRVAFAHGLGRGVARGDCRRISDARRAFRRAAIVLMLKNYVSAYIERWNMLLGFVFVFIVIFMPEGVVPGLRRLWSRWRSR